MAYRYRSTRANDTPQPPLEDLLWPHDILPPSPPPTAPRRRRGCLGRWSIVLLVVAIITILLSGFVYWQALVLRGPVHVLMLGIDQRPGETGPFRTDTMLLARFNPATRRVALLSIPRDLWVNIPTVGENRINTAHFFGGPELARQTVQQIVGVPVHYYVVVNFDGFTRIIDAMGGIDVDVPETLHDENYPTEEYGITTIHIEAGPQHMDGRTALIYARSRYSTNDFDRAQRQQQILAAMKTRLQDPTTWWRLPRVAQAVFDAVESDISRQEWVALGVIALRAKEIRRFAIGPEQVTPFITANGAYVLLPDWDAIGAVVDEFQRQ
nr:LCP family protein [Ardenticatena sp.]